MATGKNLQSIPKKVKCGGACETGAFPRNGGAEALSLGGGGDQDGASIRMPPIQRGRGGAGLGRPSGGGQLLFLCPRACPFTEELVESERPRGHRLGVTAPPSLPQTQHYFLLCFLLKFSLTISSCLVCFGFTLQNFCDSSRARNLTNCSSIMLPRWAPPPAPHLTP